MRRRAARSTRKTARFLARYPPFDGMDRAELERVAASVVEHRAVVGESVLVENGATGTYLYVVRDGTMELDHKGHVVDVVTKGQVFGHPTLLTGLAPEFTVRAREDTDLYLIPRDVALELLEPRRRRDLRRPDVARPAHPRGSHDARACRTCAASRSPRWCAAVPVFCDPATTRPGRGAAHERRDGHRRPRPEPQGSRHRHRRRPAQEGDRRRPLPRGAGEHDHDGAGQDGQRRRCSPRRPASR